MLMSFDDLHTGIALDAVNEVGTYDLCMVDGSWMAEFTENGVLANLSEMGYSFDDDIIPATTTICKVGEDIYLAPYYGNVTVMMYNKQLLADAGYAPEDIDSFADLMDIAQKTKAADSNKNGFLIRGGSADNILSDFLPPTWLSTAAGSWMRTTTPPLTLPSSRPPCRSTWTCTPWAAPWTRTTSWLP